MKSTGEYLPAPRGPSRAPQAFTKRKETMEQPQQQSNHLCAIHGCDRIGTVSHFSGPDARFNCWLHDRCKPEQIGRVANGLHEFGWMRDFCDRIVTKSLIDLELPDAEGKTGQDQINAYAIAKGHPELARKRVEGDAKHPWEGLSQWWARCRQYAFHQIAGEEWIDTSIST
jgi:hypothetical protein